MLLNDVMMNGFDGCVPCQHCMVHPQVVHGGDGLQLFRVTSVVLNEKAWLSSLEITTSHCME